MDEAWTPVWVSLPEAVGVLTWEPERLVMQCARAAETVGADRQMHVPHESQVVGSMQRVLSCWSYQFVRPGVNGLEGGGVGLDHSGSTHFLAFALLGGWGLDPEAGAFTADEGLRILPFLS